HPDPHPDAGIEAYRRLPGPMRVEPDTPGIVGDGGLEDRFKGATGDVSPAVRGIDVQARDGDQIEPVNDRPEGDRTGAPAVGEKPERVAVVGVRAREGAAVVRDAALLG